MAEILNDLVEEEGTPVEELAQAEEVTQVEVKEESVVDELIPEKFRGKSAKDIAESYLNLEREYGKKAQEIGELRKLTDQILQQQIVSTPKETSKQEEISDADFFVDPKTAVQRAIEDHPKIREFEQQSLQAQRLANKQRFEAKHPDYEGVLQEDGFQQWVTSSPVRQKLFAQANAQYDFEAADEIFTQYKEIKQLREGAKQQMNDNREAALKASTVPSGNTSTETTKKIYRRADLIRLRMTDPARYEALSDEIMKAYSEGRVK